MRRQMLRRGAELALYGCAVMCVMAFLCGKAIGLSQDAINGSIAGLLLVQVTLSEYLRRTSGSPE